MKFDVDVHGNGYLVYYCKKSAINAFREITNMNLKFGKPIVKYALSLNDLDLATFPELAGMFELSNWTTIRIDFNTFITNDQYTEIRKFISQIGEIEESLQGNDRGQQYLAFTFFDIRAASKAIQELPNYQLVNGSRFNVSFYDKDVGCKKVPLPTNNKNNFNYTAQSNDTNSAQYFIQDHNTPRSLPYINENQQNKPRNTLLYSSSVENGILKSSLLSEFGIESIDEQLRNGMLDMEKPVVPNRVFFREQGQKSKRALDSKSWNLLSNQSNAHDSGIVTKANVSKNNIIDLNRIAKGLDTRTTLMLRNIPNKVDQEMLKEYLDVTNKHTYDFLCEFIFFFIYFCQIKSN